MKKRSRRGLLTLFFALIFIFAIINITGRNESGEKIQTLNLVRGVDVSRYQGDVDFNTLYNQSIRFAFIKATEGIEYLDPKFQDNWTLAKEANLKVGAYHFYRFEHSAKEQGENFISNVVLEDGDLPPVIDLEFYGDYIKKPVRKDEVKEELRIMVDIFKEHYNKKPIIYCNKYVYNAYLSEDFDDVDIWYRYIGPGLPEVPGGREWTFWQFDDKGKLEGYGGSGANEHIDLNYFYGDMEDLDKYGRNQDN